MILADYSSIIHRMLYVSIKLSEDEAEKNGTLPSCGHFLDENGKTITSTFIKITKSMILEELINIKQVHSKKYGELVLAFDNSEVPYWRKEIYPAYKAQRKKLKAATTVNYEEVFKELKDLENVLVNYSPLPCISIPRAEADDIIFVLSSHFGKKEKMLIYSTDKDFLQSQRTSKLVDQYSPTLKKWLKPEIKNENMDDWIVEHVCLGDKSDNVPRIVDFTIFSKSFKSWLTNIGLEVLEPFEFYEKYTKEKANKLFEKFDVYKVNRKGEALEEKDIFDKPNLGAVKLHKNIKSFGSLELWLDSHPLYKKHYDLNYKLVMEEGIPDDVRELILHNYENVDRTYNQDEIEECFKRNKISQFIMELPQFFGAGKKKEIDASFFGW